MGVQTKQKMCLHQQMQDNGVQHLSKANFACLKSNWGPKGRTKRYASSVIKGTSWLANGFLAEDATKWASVGTI